jgi:hypothetical protein
MAVSMQWWASVYLVMAHDGSLDFHSDLVYIKARSSIQLALKLVGNSRALQLSSLQHLVFPEPLLGISWCWKPPAFGMLAEHQMPYPCLISSYAQ